MHVQAPWQAPAASSSQVVLHLSMPPQWRMLRGPCSLLSRASAPRATRSLLHAGAARPDRSVRRAPGRRARHPHARGTGHRHRRPRGLRRPRGAVAVRQTLNKVRARWATDRGQNFEGLAAAALLRLLASTCACRMSLVCRFAWSDGCSPLALLLRSAVRSRPEGRARAKHGAGATPEVAR